MQNINSRAHNDHSLKSFSETWTFSLIWLTFWTIPFIVFRLHWHIQEGFNFYHMTFNEARLIAAFAYCLILLMMVAYIVIAKVGKVACLPFVLYFSWAAAMQLNGWLYSIINHQAIVPVLFLALSICGLGSVKWRQLTAYALVVLNLYFLEPSFNAQVIHGSFDIVILPN